LLILNWWDSLFAQDGPLPLSTVIVFLPVQITPIAILKQPVPE
jgi:hypothetical protein